MSKVWQRPSERVIKMNTKDEILEFVENSSTLGFDEDEDGTLSVDDETHLVWFSFDV